MFLWFIVKLVSACTVKKLDSEQADQYIRNMSNNKNKDINKLADMFKALSNPNRLKIYMSLIEYCTPGKKHMSDSCNPEGCACVGELGKNLGIVPSTVSHHMKELRQAGLINMERKGQKIECWVELSTYEALKEFFD
jgi:ArsR family transcriptional regulator, arsenate/arsenite/antimonite-responsive transcriptional repressor